MYGSGILKLVFICFTCFVISCKQADNPLPAKKTHNNLGSRVAEITNINDLALFLAGLPSSKYKKIQEQSFYKNYQQITQESWQRTKINTLKPIELWINNQNITTPTDTISLLYPFSGPDLLYALIFFPYATNYVLFGLESSGSIPEIETLTLDIIAAYLENLSFSLRYINKRGYFVTKQMMTDFKKNNLDGVIHILLYYLAQTGNQTVSFTPVFIDNYGKVFPKMQFQNIDEFINGIRITFEAKDNSRKKYIYYFPIDVSDENLKENLSFVYYLNQLGKKNCLIKAGSYLLHSDSFSILRNIIINQSAKILQDDTGIPYKMLTDNNKYDIKLFGRYNRTIKVFEHFFQADLENAYDKKNNINDLPFKLGYNSNFDESILIYASEKEKQKQSNQPVTDELIYKVQVKSSWKKIAISDVSFSNLPPVEMYFDNGYYKYTIGCEKSESDCQKILKQANEQGFTDAFVVPFFNKKRITLEEAAKIYKNLNN